MLIQPIKYLLLCSSSNALLQVISSRVTGMVGEEGRSGAAPQYSFAGSAGGLLSSLQELLPTSQVAILLLVSWCFVDLASPPGPGCEQFWSSQLLLFSAGISLLGAADPPLHLHTAAGSGDCSHLPVCNSTTTFPHGRPSLPQ